MTRILTTVAALGLLTAASLPASAATTTKLTVNGMVCAFCAQGIEKKLTAMPQTRAVYVNLGEKIVAVEAKDGQTIDVEKVRGEVKDAGYEVVKVETVQESVDALRAAAKARK
jgi:copper chaperone CopZ